MSIATKVLVTGSRGQLGQTIKELYSKNDLGIDFMFTSKEELDITDEINVKSLFDNNKFDYCINCAAYTNVEQAEKTPEVAFEINSVAVKFLALACKDSNTILIHVSTDYVFDGENNEPYSVHDEANPINEYGKSKLLGEQEIQNILSKYFIVRTSWLYSKTYGNNFYRKILKKSKQQKELFVVDSETGCPTDAVNLANYLVGLIVESKSDYNILHFCDDKIMTWYDFAVEILRENKLLHQTRLVKSNTHVSSINRPKYSALLTSHLIS